MNLDDFVKDFLEEAYEKVEVIYDNLLNLENDPENEEFLNEIFRAAHTVKGSSGTMGYENIQNLMHRIENIFTMLKEGKFKFSADLNDVVLEGMDIVKDMLDNIDSGNGEDADASDVIKRLDKISSESVVEKKKTSKTKKKPAEKSKKKKKKAKPADDVDEEKITPAEENEDTDRTVILTDIEKDIIKQELSGDNNIYNVKIFFSKKSLMPSVGRFLVMRELENVSKVINSNPGSDELNEDKYIPYGEFIISFNNDLSELKHKLLIPNEVDVVEVEEYSDGDDKIASLENTLSENGPEISDEEGEDTSEYNSQEESDKDNNGNDQVEKKQKPTKKETIQSLRVDSIKIDQLLNLIGEQVINTSRYFRMENEVDRNLFNIRNLINDMNSGSLDKEGMHKKMTNLYNEVKRFSEEYKETNLMTRRLNNDMQQNTMKVRMLPIEKVFRRFPRMVRDISRELDKKIQLEIEGQETELDKTVIEILSDPLVHIIRNSLDHGIESAEERKVSGKEPEGKIVLRASHEGNYIFIEVIDDGRGLSREKILAKAVEKGMIMEGTGDNMKDREVFGLIFEPGFSTAEKVTGLSGRGVGMDVVKRSLEKVNGTVEVDSKFGKGTCVRIKLPLTMAIIQALLVKGLDQVFSIPLNSVVETVKLKKDSIYHIKGNKAINIRDNVISVISIEEAFHMSEKDRESFYIVILGYGEKQVGLIVDKLYGEQEIVIKNLDSDLVNTPGIAGANILGDGRVSLILDINKIIERAGS